MIDQSLLVDRQSVIGLPPHIDRPREPLGFVSGLSRGAVEGAQATGTRSAASAVARVLQVLRVSDSVAMSLAAGGVALVLGTQAGSSLAADAVLALCVIALAVPAWLLSLSLARAYEPRHLFSGSAEMHRIAIAGASFALVVSNAGWLLLDRSQAPVFIAGIAVLLLGTLAGRWIVRMRVQRANRAGASLSRVMAVGDSHELPGLVGRLHRNRYHGWEVVAMQALDLAAHPHASADSTVAEIVRAAKHHDADVVLLATSGGALLHSIAELQRELHNSGRDLALAPPLVEAVGPRVSIETVCGLPVVRISAPELSGPRRLLKDVLDRSMSLLGFLAILPLLAVIATAIRFDSSGPALFRQRRVGRNGHLFTVWKFRTMHVDAEARQAAIDAANEGAGPLFKIRKDPRVTRVGSWLRRTSLDELPQLINVIIGDMSIVGPRPALPREVAQYDDLTRRRLLVRPGITGLWQVSGRSDLPWDETKRLDVRYVENWSLGFDISIILRTVDTMVRSKGAY